MSIRLHQPSQLVIRGNTTICLPLIIIVKFIKTTTNASNHKYICVIGIYIPRHFGLPDRNSPILHHFSKCTKCPLNCHNISPRSLHHNPVSVITHELPSPQSPNHGLSINRLPNVPWYPTPPLIVQSFHRAISIYAPEGLLCTTRITTIMLVSPSLDPPTFQYRRGSILRRIGCITNPTELVILPKARLQSWYPFR